MQADRWGVAALAFFGKSVMCACVINHCSCVQLFATRWTVAYQALLSMGFSRQECWYGFPCPPPGESSWTRDQTWVSYVSCIFFFFFFFNSVRYFIIYTLQGSLVSAFDILGGWGSNRSNSFYPVEPRSNLNPSLHGSKAHSPFVAFQNLSWEGETCQQESKQGFEESH